MLHIIPIPAFEDNYIWLVHNGQFAIVIDPGDAVPVLNVIQNESLTLIAILITHHHADHIAGVAEIVEQIPQAIIYAPLLEKDYFKAFKHQSVIEGAELNFSCLNLKLKVMETPGHTLGHIVYYAQNEHLLFCGDTLFGAGCGRLFEGTPLQMLNSLKRLAQLPTQTKVYCTHEYTEKNIRFARMIDPENEVLASRQTSTHQQRLEGVASLPSTLALELETNPFLRCQTTAIKNAAKSYKNNNQLYDELSIFTTIRIMRNHY